MCRVQVAVSAVLYQINESAFMLDICCGGPECLGKHQISRFGIFYRYKPDSEMLYPPAGVKQEWKIRKCDLSQGQERRNGLLFYVPMPYFQLEHDKSGFKLIYVLKCIGNLAVFPTCDCLGWFFSMDVVQKKWLRGNGKGFQRLFWALLEDKMQHC